MLAFQIPCCSKDVMSVARERLEIKEEKLVCRMNVVIDARYSNGYRSARMTTNARTEQSSSECTETTSSIVTEQKQNPEVFAEKLKK